MKYIVMSKLNENYFEEGIFNTLEEAKNITDELRYNKEHWNKNNPKHKQSNTVYEVYKTTEEDGKTVPNWDNIVY